MHRRGTVCKQRDTTQDNTTLLSPGLSRIASLQRRGSKPRLKRPKEQSSCGGGTSSANPDCRGEPWQVLHLSKQIRNTFLSGGKFCVNQPSFPPSDCLDSICSANTAVGPGRRLAPGRTRAVWEAAAARSQPPQGGWRLMSA